MTRFRQGTAFLDRYVLLGPVGRGGVSVVYEALDTSTGKHVAIKMLDPTLAGDTRAQERIRREAIITDRMRHPSVPRIHEYGDAPLGDGTSVAYVVMELLDGTVLTDYLADGPLPWPDAVQVAATIADVLAVAHKRGVVHRDLTPANIMITEGGARIIDFGVAITVQTPDHGTGPYVLPPGPRRTNDFAGPGEPADDVYALGVLLHQMMTGESPLANQPPPTATASMRLSAPTPVVTAPGVPRSLADLCRRCLAKHPSERPDAARVALDLWSLIVPAQAPATWTPADPAPIVRPAPIVQSAPMVGPAFAPTRPAAQPPVQRPPYDWAVREPGPSERDSPRHHPLPGPTDRGPGDEARLRRRSPSWTGRSSGHRTVDRARRPSQNP